MSSKEIKELRQAGKLDEALQMANETLAVEPDNIWNKRAISWVYYAFLKKHSTPDQFEIFKENLIKIKELELPSDEHMLFDNCAWQIGKMVFGLNKTQQIDYGKINTLFELIKDFHFTKPSEAYTFIYKAFHKVNKGWSNYLEFADWWNLENLLAEDYLKEELDGRMLMPVAEQAYIAYAKKLLEGTPLDAFGHEKEIDKEKIQAFLPALELVIEKHPDYLYPPYFKAKLLLALGNAENVMESFIPFAKKKRNEFWVWQLLAEIMSSDNEAKFACFCKALSLKTSEDFLLKIRKSFAAMLIQREMYAEAKTEIEKVIQVINKNEWSLPNQIKDWTNQDWYANTSSNKDNQDVYAQHTRKAEELLFQNIQEELVAVEFVNEHKQVLNFVKDQTKYGFFKYKGCINNPKIGDVLKVRFDGDGQDNYFKILTAKVELNPAPMKALKQFSGLLKVNTKFSFGFVDDIFISPDLMKKDNLLEGSTISGQAIMSFNKKKNEWGWKALSIEKEQIQL